MSSDDGLDRAEELLSRLEQARAELEQTQDTTKQIEILQELAQLAKDVEAELQRVKREAESGGSTA